MKASKLTSMVQCRFVIAAKQRRAISGNQLPTNHVLVEDLFWAIIDLSALTIRTNHQLYNS